VPGAWRRLNSNPDASYKNYFRRFALADAALLRDLHERLKGGLYEPEHAWKLYFPKPSIARCQSMHLLG
jgi:hypothetical protein